MQKIWYFYKKTKKFKELNNLKFSINEDILNRKADFILIKNNKIINIEVNYFFSSGSKPEEIVDSYINRKNDLKQNNIEFILISDGLCWNNEFKSQLNKVFKYIDLMNFYMASNGYLEDIIKTYLDIK
ncbi:DpnII family type II restriction endonuclease [Mesomycoplasma lagogenitalium]|uniref:DpnII family type II restriction endonuclease n=1 Tax=Mesomycoplasma lagogenitalium TaxID=171286 RepID=A0ABY8LU75_9BACT|nr:DpnII family type II restriction endonuclease [Mesomycoplasma lagogenitalium]WGI36787.1 DpnII family type II restriction endonuclease [Mesomycoplasma lagogenitalium]